MTCKGKKVGIAIWVALHAILFVFAALLPWKVETDLYSILPDSNEFKSVSTAEKVLSERTMSNVSVLLGHENFEVAKKAAESLDSIFGADSGFAETRLRVDADAMRESRQFLFENRYVLQSPKVRQLLQAGNLQQLQDKALQKIYGAFGIADLGNLDSDPLLLGEQSFDYFTLESPLMSGKFSLREDVLVAVDSADAQEKQIFYVMWSAVLSPKTSAMASDGHALERLNHSLDSLKNAAPGLKVAKSGVPFHSYESSRNAQKEVTWISVISIILVLILLLSAFRSPLPIFCTLISIGVAAAAALSGSWIIFGSIHVFTFVFGTSIIGVSIDYAIHFFTDWKNSAGSQESGFDVRHHIFKGLLLGFLTTELSYMALTFAGFDLLKQMAVFSIIGLASSFATILLIFPNIPVQKKQASLPLALPTKFLDAYEFAMGTGKKKFWLQPALLTVFVVALIPGVFMLDVKTDMRALYTMSEELKQSEILNARLNNLGISPNYFIVEGETAEEVLQQEEVLRSALDSAVADSSMKGYLAASAFLPSVKTQRETHDALQKSILQDTSLPGDNIPDTSLPGDSIPDTSLPGGNIPDTSLRAQGAKQSTSILSPSFSQYLNSIGVTNDSAFSRSLFQEPSFLTPESEMPSSFKAILNMLWIGQVNGKFYSAVLPLHVTSKFDAATLVKDLPHVYAVNKMENINGTLTELSRMTLMLVAVAYLIVFAILVVVYKFRTAVKVIRAPVIACIFLASVFGYCGITFNFFAITGVILTLGIGIDYALFFREGGKRNLPTALAVMLSAATTVISFGSLAFSSFVPVSTFGLATLLGILCCFILSPCSRE